MTRLSIAASIVIVLLAGASGLAAGAPPEQPPYTYFAYLSPRPNAELLPPGTTIILRPRSNVGGWSAAWMSTIKVEGTRSGIHSGDWVVADDGRTLIFKPHREFERGERVEVSIDLDATQRTRFTFRITTTDPSLRDERADPLGCERSVEPQPLFQRAAIQPSWERQLPYTLPSDFPAIAVTHSDNPDPGYIFLSDFPPNPDLWTSSYLMILDNTGAPVFFRKVPTFAVDFKPQPNGLLSYYLYGTDTFFIMDSTYTVVNSYAAGNGYVADLHELAVLPDGHALMTIYDPQTIDMSVIVAGGDSAATVIGFVVQEQDQSKNVVFEWRSWDHYEITDATHLDFTADRIDYVHGNAIDQDTDGNLLISARHMDEITKIDHQTGDVIWRLGGKNNQFTLLGDTLWFSYQHAIRRTDNGDITLFDNGNYHTPPESRAVEYSLDETGMVATKVWDYRNVPATWGSAMGYVQRLAGGNTVIGWGSTTPTMTEVRPDGSKALEFSFETGIFSYRAFRFPWSGTAAAPYLWADTASTSVTLHFTKFGDANVQQYYVYAGESPDPTARVDSTAGNAVVIDSLGQGVHYYFRVTSVDDQMIESPFSNELDIVLGTGMAVLITSFEAANDGNGVRLSWAIGHADGLEGFNIYKAQDPEGAFARVNGGYLSPRQNAYYDADVTPGQSFWYRLGAVDRDGEFLSPTVGVSIPPRPVALDQNYPNPFNPGTKISFYLPEAARVTVGIYDVAGRRVRTLLNEKRDVGRHVLLWDGMDDAGNRVSSGVYFYRLTSGKTPLTKKLVVVR